MERATRTDRMIWEKGGIPNALALFLDIITMLLAPSLNPNEFSAATEPPSWKALLPQPPRMITSAKFQENYIYFLGG